MTSSVVRTVTGDVDGVGLGHIQPHEHLIADASRTARNLAMADTEALAQAGIDRADRHLITEAIALENHYWVRRHVYNVDNLALDDRIAALADLRRYRDLGGTAIVDCTPEGLGRDPAGLAELARASAVPIVMGCGAYLRPFHPPFVDLLTSNELADRFVREIVVGVGDPPVRAGVIGEIGLGWPMHPAEEKVLRAACRAQRATGAGIQIHPGRHHDAPVAAVRVIDEERASVDKVSISHLDRTYFDVPSMVPIARSGCFLELDLFGQESSYYPYAPIDLPNDATRQELVRGLIDAGHLSQVLISQDLGYKTLLTRYGGPGYAHILVNVLPDMRRRGFTAAQIEQITVDNPLRLLKLDA